MNTRGAWFMRDIPVIIWLTTAVIIALIHPFFDSSRWLLVHLVALGGFTHSIMVWSVHFTNALLKTPDVESRRTQNIRLILLQLGMLAVFIGVPTTLWWLTILGAAMISGVILWHAAMLAYRLRIALPGRFRISVRYYIVAAAFLPVGAALGVLLARGLPGDWHGKLLVAHTMVNLLGWVGLAILGTLVTLWPTMLRTKMADGAERASVRALPILTTGLSLVVASPLIDLAWLGVIGVGLYLVGTGIVYVPIIQAARNKAPHSFPTLSASAALIWLPIALVTLAVKILTDGWATLAQNYGVLTGMFLVGFALQMLFGALSHLVPVVIGGGPRPLKAGIAEINRLGTWRVVTANLAIALCLLPVPSIVRVILSAIALVALALALVFILRAIIVMIRTKRAMEHADDGELPKPEPMPTPKVSAPQVIASVAVIALGATLGVGLDPTAAGLGSTPQSPVAEEQVEPTGEVTEIEVTAADMRFSPASVDVPVGNELVIHLTNTDASEVHDLVLANGVDSGRLAPGESTTIAVGVITENLEGWCSIVGHRQMGMVFDVNAIGATSTDGDEHDHTDMATPGAGAAAELDFMASWSQDFEGYDPKLEPAPATTKHEYTFEVTEETIEVSPGVEQLRWTFNGDSTGPTLRGNIGDTFRITLVNNGTMGHSIDFHASHVAPDEPMRTIAPGESLVYEFTADRAGVWMYHCGTAPMTAHIGAGMAGAVIIDPPDLDPVDHEYIITQSELYLGANGEAIDVDKALAGQSDAVMFNGYVNQYIANPLEVTTGDRVRFWVLNNGPNKPLSFHIVGGQYDTVYKEGTYQLRNGRGALDPAEYDDGGAQALDLMPAQGGFVELDFPEAGHYTMVNHIMADAEHGAKGIVEVTD
ncbi:multicopper oxidase domain-containing protein [Enteractinococcus helveticum]|uniref:Copper-containing nitrite reductase n=1 Tax=Enteractinococcus helveticum TaxID=1837282 RepID=A0A1B7LVK6_9MICC|nr:multicopper oxidase domain-containing protein [Enteractinococcus helveticum]OAV53333.1 copper oxidase [Enteractinococcus helveticum]